MKLTALIGLALLQASAGAGGCQPTSEAPPTDAEPGAVAGPFASFDITQDGRLSGTEVAACACAHLDANGDGEVSRAEFQGDPARAARPTAPDVPAPDAGKVAEGVYETYFFGYDGLLNKWLAGDIEVLPGGRYTFHDEAGRYAYDPATGRVTWTGGGLDGVYTVLRESDGRPALVIPHHENAEAGRELALADVWGYLRR